MDPVGKSFILAGRHWGWLVALVVLAHLPLVSTPFFWDEAGYYVPAAADLFATGALVPQSVPSSGHPPLLSLYISAAWSLFGHSIPVARIAILLLTSLGLPAAVYWLAHTVGAPRLALPAMLCTAAYPTVFAQGTMVLPDLPCAALALLGLVLYFRGKTSAALLFTAAVLMKETAIFVPLALLCLDLRGQWKRHLTLTGLPLAALVLWYTYHWSVTGTVFGSAPFFEYNLLRNLDPARAVTALALRLWQAFGHLGMFVLTLLALRRIRNVSGEALRLGAVVAAYLLAHSVLGGAPLARYLLPVIPLVILGALAASRWPRTGAALAVAAFLLCLSIPPPYHFAPEEDLLYVDFVRLHREAAAYLERNHRREVISTTWPASMELTRPDLGYVHAPLRVTEQPTNLTYVFDREYQPADTPWRPRRILRRLAFWKKAPAYFGPAPQPAPPQGRTLWQGAAGPFRAAVIAQP